MPDCHDVAPAASKPRRGRGRWWGNLRGVKDQNSRWSAHDGKLKSRDEDMSVDWDMIVQDPVLVVVYDSWCL